MKKKQNPLTDYKVTIIDNRTIEIVIPASSEREAERIADINSLETLRKNYKNKIVAVDFYIDGIED